MSTLTQSPRDTISVPKPALELLTKGYRLVYGYIADATELPQKAQDIYEDPDLELQVIQKYRHALTMSGLANLDKQDRLDRVCVNKFGKMRTTVCLTLADTSRGNPLVLPPDYMLKKIRELLQTTESPSWYIACSANIVMQQ